MAGVRAAGQGIGWRGALWLGFFGLVLAGWVALWAMGQERAALSGSFGLALLAELCGGDVAALRFPALFAMWAVMSAAMMAPTAAPAFATWMRLPRGGSGGPVGTMALMGGYLALWLGASAGFALAQRGLALNGLVGADGGSLSLWLTAGLFLMAGGYQFSRLKGACLSRCRAPLTFFVAHWRPGPTGAFAAGLRLGLVCLGCCWALMALAFVGGMTNLLWMGLATALMVVEKLPEAGRRLTRPLGGALLLAGGAAALLAMGGLT
ncbi:MAG: DUF2182 domain-containing protein [Gemmobacter sp.]